MITLREHDPSELINVVRPLKPHVENVPFVVEPGNVVCTTWDHDCRGLIVHKGCSSNERSPRAGVLWAKAPNPRGFIDHELMPVYTQETNDRTYETMPMNTFYETYEDVSKLRAADDTVEDVTWIYGKDGESFVEITRKKSTRQRFGWHAP